MTSEETTGWRKSSYSAGNAECVEVATYRQAIGVRDTTLHASSPVLEFPAVTWRAFIAEAKHARS